MTTETTPHSAQITKETWRRFTRAIAAFATSDVRRRAAALFATLLVLMLAINGLNVLNSYVGRDFMTAIEQRQRGLFVREALRYVGVFALATIAAVFFRFTEERLGLEWRAWLTRRMVAVYLADRTFWRMTLPGGLANPDQRIAEDVRTFVAMTLSLTLMVLNGMLTVVAFSGVLWSISRPLFLVGIAYAAVGSGLTILLGRRLVPLHYTQADREADFRAALIHVREHADGIAALGREPQLHARLRDRIDALVANMRRIIAVNRNVGFFTTGYNYMIQIIPALIVAPLFIRGDVAFGVITQSAMAFSHLLGAFSLVVTQFQAISSYAAVLARLSALAEAAQPAAVAHGIETVEDPDRVAFEHLTLQAPQDGRVLVSDLTATVPHGTRLLVHGADSAAARAVLHALAGMWEHGTGRLVRPSRADFEILPETPYVPPGTLRDLLRDVRGATAPSDDAIAAALDALGVRGVIARAGSLCVERDWTKVLSLREQALVSIARVLLTRPRFVALDHPGRTLDEAQVEGVLAILTRHGTSCIVLGAAQEPLAAYDARLEFPGDGRWHWERLRPASADREAV